MNGMPSIAQLIRDLLFGPRLSDYDDEDYDAMLLRRQEKARRRKVRREGLAAARERQKAQDADDVAFQRDFGGNPGGPSLFGKSLFD